MLQTCQVWNCRGCSFAGRWETEGKIGVDWVLFRSGSPSSRVTTSQVISPVAGFNENTSTDATVLINSICLRCDLYSSPLWETETSAVLIPFLIFSFLLMSLACFFFFFSFFPEQRHRSADAWGVSESHQWALHSELLVRLLLFVLYLNTAPESWAEPETCQADALSALHIKHLLSPSSRGCWRRMSSSFFSTVRAALILFYKH